MPRAVPTSRLVAAPTPAMQARPNKVAKAPVPPPMGARTFMDAALHKESCPLCIEDMDETDLSFLPCPCGYRVCLFCYEQIKLHCRSQCPGCRREYGKVDEEGSPPALSRTVSEPDEMRERPAQQPTAQSSARPIPQPSTHHNTQQAPRSVVALKPAVPVAAVKRGPDQAPRRHEDVTPGLPSGATWATQRQDTGNSSSAPVADEMAWPSLADSTAQAKPRPDDSIMHSHRRSASITSSVDRLPSVNSSSDLMSQDPVVLPEQLGLPQSMLHSPAGAGFYQQAQVSTSVFGMSRTVNLQLGGSQGEPYPEAVSLLSTINQAVRAGTLSSKDAAGQLVALLKQKEAQNGGKVQSLLAAGKAPPGFAVPAAPAPIAPPPVISAFGQQGMGLSAQLGGSLLNPLDSPIVPAPPIGRYQPIGKPIGPPGGLQQSSQGGMSTYGSAYGQQQQGSGTYSMWSGLPGIELATGGYNPLGAAPSWGQDGLGQQQSLSNMSTFTSGGGAKAPPPGFAHLAAGSVATAESRYNPLAARAPPPGMSSYRPQLGAGL